MRKQRSAAAVAGLFAIALTSAAVAADNAATTNSPNRNTTNQLYKEGAAQSGVGSRDTRGVRQMRSQQEWAAGYAREHNGRITRDAYMTAVGRRWAAADRNGQGLTPEELNALYGNSTGAPAAGSNGRR